MQRNLGGGSMLINDAQVHEVLNKFYDLSVETKDGQILLVGSIKIDHIYRDTNIVDTYQVEVQTNSNYPDQLPIIREVGGKIDMRYGHIDKDRILCLATEADMRINLGRPFRLIEWLEKYVISYFLTYSYYKMYGVMPDGERSHNEEGILEFYTEYFGFGSTEETRGFLKHVCSKNYKGHHNCPCNSGKRIRDCHKDKILELRKSDFIDIFKADYARISKR